MSRLSIRCRWSTAVNSVDDRAADLLGRRVGRAQVGHLLLELLQPAHPRVEVGVGEGRVVEDVVAPARLLDLLGQAAVLLAQLGQRVRAGVVSRCCRCWSPSLTGPSCRAAPTRASGTPDRTYPQFAESDASRRATHCTAPDRMEHVPAPDPDCRSRPPAPTPGAPARRRADAARRRRRPGSSRSVAAQRLAAAYHRDARRARRRGSREPGRRDVAAALRRARAGTPAPAPSPPPCPTPAGRWTGLARRAPGRARRAARPLHGRPHRGPRGRPPRPSSASSRWRPGWSRADPVAALAGRHLVAGPRQPRQDHLGAGDPARTSSARRRVAASAEFVDMGRLGHYMLRPAGDWNRFALDVDARGARPRRRALRRPGRPGPQRAGMTRGRRDGCTPAMSSATAPRGDDRPTSPPPGTRPRPGPGRPALRARRAGQLLGRDRAAGRSPPTSASAPGSAPGRSASTR